jgi:hypothetical protein
MRTTRKPDPPSIAYSTSADFPMPAGPVNKSAPVTPRSASPRNASIVALGGATDETVAPMRPVSGIEHARHDTASAAAFKHIITADRLLLPNVASPVAADEARDLGASGGPGQAP